MAAPNSPPPLTTSSTNNGTPFPSPPTHDSCNDTYEKHHDDDDDTLTRMRMASSNKIAGRAIAPFLARHIPAAYAPTGAAREGVANSAKDPSTKFCYRHRPDLKCRRTADEPSMDNLQRVSLMRLPSGDGRRI